MSTSMPFFKAYPKEIFFEFQACKPDDAPLVFYLAMVVWADQGIDPTDTKRVENLRRMLGWRKDNFNRALESYLEICEQTEGKRLPKFLCSQLRIVAPKIQKDESDIYRHSQTLPQHSQTLPQHSQTLPQHSQTFTDIQKNALKSNESSRVNTSEVRIRSHNQKLEGESDAQARENAPFSSFQTSTPVNDEIEREIDVGRELIRQAFNLPIATPRHVEQQIREAAMTLLQVVSDTFQRQASLSAFRAKYPEKAMRFFAEDFPLFWEKQTKIVVPVKKPTAGGLTANHANEQEIQEIMAKLGKSKEQAILHSNTRPRANWLQRAVN